MRGSSRNQSLALDSRAPVAVAHFGDWRSVLFMVRHGVIATLVLVNSFVFTATLSAQMSSVEGSVVDVDGRPLKDAEIRFEQKEGQVSPIVSRSVLHTVGASSFTNGGLLTRLGAGTAV